MEKSERILAISDIHGYGHLLSKLLMEMNYSPGNDQLILLGDYVNKGPDSIGTLEQVKQLTQEGAIAIIGNNELRWMMCNHAAVKDYIEFLYSLHTWYVMEPYIFVHAGFKKDVLLHHQSVEDMTGCNNIIEYETVDNLITIFGHTPTFRLGVEDGKVWVGKNKLGIDTGAG